MRQLVYLVGPFIGELEWEYRYFAPYIIHLMRENSKYKFIIFTRPSRFDLYGEYADVFVPLRISYDKKEIQNKFTIKGFRIEDYKHLTSAFVKKYKMQFRIHERITPDISQFMYKVKWQFPKERMIYDFRPRYKNIEIAEKLVVQNGIFVDNNKAVKSIKIPEYYLINSSDFVDYAENMIDPMKSTILGCCIEAIKRSEVVIGNLSSNLSKLSLLLRTPLITINEKLTDDSISLINPYNTPIIKCNNVMEGIRVYENYFRPPQRRAG